MERGRRRTISERVREHICLIARTPPADWVLTGFATWSLSKLADHLVQRHVVPIISRQALRRILRSGKISWQATTMWKASADLNFIAKMHRVPGPVRHPAGRRPGDMRRRVRPLNLQPRKGRAWRPVGKSPPTTGHLQPVRRRDVHACRPRPGRWQDLLQDPAAQTLARVPRPAQDPSLAWEKLYVVLDNFHTHKHAEVLSWAADDNVELVFLPTYGSWLGWIESEFAALRCLALNGTDHRTHEEQNAAIAAYIRWRNARAEPKTNFAPDSPIRQWTAYPSKAA
ncbi:transposase [Streptomyces phaeochromogenes]